MDRWGARTFVLLLIQLSTEGSEYFKNQNLSFFTSPVPTIMVIIYFIIILDSLGNCIFINIYYIPIFRILRGEIYLKARYLSGKF